MQNITRRDLVSTAGATVASVAVAGCIGDSGSGSDGSGNNSSTGTETNWPSENVTGEVGETPSYLEITSFSAYSTGDDVGVLGTVQNVGNDHLDNVEVEVTLHDGDTVIGEFVDASSQDIDDLRPDNKWQFYIVFEGEQASNATSYTVSADAEAIEG